MADCKARTIQIDPHGNLKLHVGSKSKQTTFIVSSNAMCLASCVWRAMFSSRGHFAEASSIDGEASFPEDDTTAFLILINIAHLHFLKVPQILTCEQLFDIAVLCDKYDSVTLVRPWFEAWIKVIDGKAGPSLSGTRRLFIAWVFGERAVFEDVAKRISMRCTLNKKGQILNLAGKPFRCGRISLVIGIFYSHKGRPDSDVRSCRQHCRMPHRLT